MKKKNILLYFTDQQRPLPRHVPDRQMGDGYRLFPE